MRAFLLALMIVLLPVRGWMGDAMAAQMLAQKLLGQASSATVATEGAAHDSVMHDCPGHGAEAGSTEAPQTEKLNADCGTCSACQVCHSSACLGSASALPLLKAPHASPRSGPMTFASVDPLAGFKPPRF
jgi:hypothetical protein